MYVTSQRPLRSEFFAFGQCIGTEFVGGLYRSFLPPVEEEEDAKACAVHKCKKKKNRKS